MQEAYDNNTPDTIDPVKPDPIYAWHHRPEYQFSQVQFEVSEINKTITDDTDDDIVLNIIEGQVPAIAPGNEIEILFDYLSNTINRLQPIDGPQDLVLAMGENEYQVAIGEDQKLILPDLSYLDNISSEDYLTLRLYSNNDTANTLWEWAFESNGFIVDSSRDSGSRSANSFSVCPRGSIPGLCQEEEIRFHIADDLEINDQILWSVEALEGNNSLEDFYSATPPSATLRRKAYGQTKEWRIGRQSADTAVSGNQDSSVSVNEFGGRRGAFGEPWSSGYKDFIDARYFSFKPDLRPLFLDESGNGDIFYHEENTYRRAANCSGQYDTDNCTDGTNKTDVWRRNPHIGYKVTAYVNGTERYSAIVKMDEIDVLRQEYINHRRGNTHFSYPIPERNGFKLIASNPAYQEMVEGPCNGRANCVDHPYSYLLDKTGLLIRNDIQRAFESHRNDTFTGLQIKQEDPDNPGSPLINPETGQPQLVDSEISIAGEWNIKLGSTYRNPERNERVGGVLGSRHQFGGAVDIGFYSGTQYTDISNNREVTAGHLLRAKASYIVWRIMNENLPNNATLMLLEPSANNPMIKVKECTNWQASYHRNSAGNRPHQDEESLTTIDNEPLFGDGVPDGFKFSDHIYIQDDRVTGDLQC